MADRTKAMLVLAREHLEKREIDRAERLLARILEREDGWADVHHLVALIARERGDFVRAAAHLERAVAINPRFVEALLALAITYNDLGRYDESRDLRERLAARQPADRPEGTRAEDLDPFILGKLANQHAALAQAYRDAGCLGEAARELRRAVELRPGFPDLRVRLATTLRDLGEVPSAIAQLEEAVAWAPRYVEAHVQLGLCFLAEGRREEARAALAAALALEPRHERAKAYARVAAAAEGSPEERGEA